MAELNGYYNRFDPTKNYDRHMFRAGYVLQSSELNEIQSRAANRTKNIADALFKDGDVIRDAQLIVNSVTGETQCQPGAVYIAGEVRGVPPKTMTIPVTGVVSVGIRLVETVITELDDPALRDPAIDVRNYQEPGAARLKIEAIWSHFGDGLTGEFYPVYTVEDGVLKAKEAPPAMDSVTHAIATYDRDNSGGTYVVNGLNVEATPGPSAGIDSFNISAGRARVGGYAVTFNADARLNRTQNPDLRLINAEPHLADNSGNQRIDVDRAPIDEIIEVQVTRQKTVSITRGMVGGGQDTLPDSSILQLVSVTQGATTYVIDTEVKLTAGKVDWSLPGAEPSGGSTYNVTYRHIATDIPAPEEYDEDGLSVLNAVEGTLILITYQAKLPRIDRLCIDRDGNLIWANGISDDYAPREPASPPNTLPLARVLFTWRSTQLPQVINDAVRTVSMGELQQINARIDSLADLLARNQLATDANLREAVLKKGLLVDPFIDNSVRDFGQTQDAAIALGALSMPIDATADVLDGANAQPNVLTRTGFTQVLKQESVTGGMKVNPYMAFPPQPAVVTLDPVKDYWTETKVRNTNSVTVQNITNASAKTAYLGARYHYGHGSLLTYAGSSTEISTSSSETSTTSVTKQKVGDLENLREIEVQITAIGFAPNEELTELRFDGLPVTPVAI